MSQLPESWFSKEWILHHKQVQAWTTTARFVLIAAGRGSGKTELAKRYLVRHLPLQKPWSDPRYFYGAPTLPQAKRIAWFSLLSLIPKSWLAAPPNKSELVIETIFGSTIHVVSFDKPQRIEGVQWDGGVCDESCDIKPGTIARSILPALTWRKGWLWRIGVPKRHGIGAVEFRTDFEKAEREGRPETLALTWPSSDVVPEEHLRIMRSKLDEYDYLEQFGAHFLNATGGIFHSFDPDVNVRPCTYDPKQTIYVGSDFNVNPMAWVLCHIRRGPPDLLEVFDEIFLRDCNTGRALKTLKERYSHHPGGFRFFGDATSRSRKTAAFSTDYQQIVYDQELRKMGRTIHYPRSNPPQADRFAVTNSLLCSADGIRRLFVSPTCIHLINDLKLRRTKDGSREADDVGDLGHPTDALGYIVWQLFPLVPGVVGRITPEVQLR